MAWNDAAVDSLYNAIVAGSMKLGRFEQTRTHEPKNAPGSGLHLAVWLDTIKPVPSSGLDQTSGLVSFFVRIYNPMLAEPQDDIDPQIMKATSALMGAYTGDFNFGAVAQVRNIDLLGQYGDGLAAQAGYMEISGKLFRVMVITLPIIIDNLWVQTP